MTYTITQHPLDMHHPQQQATGDTMERRLQIQHDENVTNLHSICSCSGGVSLTQKCKPNAGCAAQALESSRGRIADCGEPPSAQPFPRVCSCVREGARRWLRLVQLLATLARSSITKTALMRGWSLKPAPCSLVKRQQGAGYPLTTWQLSTSSWHPSSEKPYRA